MSVFSSHACPAARRARLDRCTAHVRLPLRMVALPLRATAAAHAVGAQPR